MPAQGQVFINGHQYSIAGETLVPKGKRAYLRRLRALQDSEPGIPRTVRWKLSGPIGLSREGPNGELGHDYGTLETRYDDLLTSLGAVSTLTVSSSDPFSSSSAALGAMPLGVRALGGGSSLATPTTITHIKEDHGYLFLGRGSFLTQIAPSSWAVVTTKNIGAVVRGMELWFNKLRVGLGGQKAIQTLTGITSTGFTASDTQVSGSDTNGKAMVVGNNRLTWIRADSAGTNENRIRYTYDDFTTQSGGTLVVGDPGVNATGLGTMGPYTLVGSEVGIFGFTDEGIPFNVARNLRNARSVDNGRQFAELDGWTYEITSRSLFATRGQTTNPIGIGTLSMGGFEGFDGKPVAILDWFDDIIVCYEDSAGTTWRLMLGVFNANLTPGTGERDWYPFATRTNASVRCIGATSTPTLPTIVWGEGANTLARIARGRGGRDISDSSYPYSTAGGQWFGSTMMRNQHLRKTVRWARIFTENCDASNTFRVAVAFDGGSYTNLGSAAITSNGAQKIVPSTITSAPTGFTPKPRLTQVAASSTTPPQLRGFLELGLDERPDQVTEVAVVFQTSKIERTRLRNLADADSSDGRQPVVIKLPGESTTYYGYINMDDEQDLQADAVTGCAVTLVLVDAA